MRGHRCCGIWLLPDADGEGASGGIGIDGWITDLHLTCAPTAWHACSSLQNTCRLDEEHRPEWKKCLIANDPITEFRPQICHAWNDEQNFFTPQETNPIAVCTDATLHLTNQIFSLDFLN